MKNFSKIVDNFDVTTKKYVDDGLAEKANSADLATVATSGSYDDLSNKPTIPDVSGKLDKSGGTITGDLTVGGSLTINGTTTTVNSTTLQVKDKLIEVAHGNTTALTTPAGLVAPKYDGTNSGALVFDSTGTAYVGDVTLKDGNIDVANSQLQPLATRTGLVGGNLVQYDSSAQTLKDSGKKISDLALKTDIPDVSGKLSKTENTGVNVLGTTKSTTTLGGNQLVAPNGIIFSGTAANAGLVTRGICGVTTPDSEGACSKENLYINYDGNNDFNAGRQVVLNAGAVGNHLGSNMYQYAVPRGDIVKAWVEAQGYLTSQDVSGKANLAGGNTFSDLQTINAPTNVNGSEQTTMKVKTSNDGAIIFGKEGPNSGTMIRLDQTDGTCRLRFRSSATAGAMVWEQPESGAQLYVDLGARDGDYHRVQFPSGAGTLALTSQIPTKVSELTNDSGYTTNKGTVTQVKINGTTKSPDSAGLVDLGTVGGSSDNSKFDYTVLTNEDLNTVIEAGRYRGEQGNTCAHNPIFGRPMPAFFLTVETNGSGVVRQTAYVAEGIANTYFQWYVRVSDNNGSSWAKWIEQQSMTGDYSQSFASRKFFDNGIGISSSLQFSNDAGSNGQFAMSQGSSSAPKWVNLQVKVNGTTYTADSSGLIDLGEISGGGGASKSPYNDIY